MTAHEFRAALGERGLSQSAFCREIERLSGERLPLRTVQGWALGEYPVPVLAAAVLALMPMAEPRRKAVGALRG